MQKGIVYLVSRFLMTAFALTVIFAPLSARSQTDVLDPLFGSQGITTVNISGSRNYLNTCNRITLQNDEKIVLAGLCTDSLGQVRIAVARLDPNGLPDTAFGIGGSETLSVPGAGFSCLAYDCVVAPDGKILLAGNMDSNPKFPMIVMRLDSNGCVDTTFGDSGTVILNSGNSSVLDVATGISVLDNGKIIVGGYSQDNQQHYAYVLARLESNGTPDSSFAGGGIERVSVASGNWVSAVSQRIAIESDGKIVMAGYAEDNTSRCAFEATRFDSNGVLDNTFGSSGTVRLWIAGGSDSSDIANDVAVSKSGKIVMAGYSAQTGRKFAVAVAVLDSNGSIDNSFGAGGTERFAIAGGAGTGDGANSVKIGPDGRIIVGGYSMGANGRGAFAIAVLDSDGTAHLTVDGSGTVRVPIDSTEGYGDRITDIALQPDGKIVAAGVFGDTSSTIAAAIRVARFIPLQQILSITPETVDVPSSFVLRQNFPNPFNPSTSVSYTLRSEGRVVLTIYDILGQSVMREDYGIETAGVHEKSIDMSAYASGIYMYRLEEVGKDRRILSATRKMMLIK